ncbi:MAG: hypothetical protein AB8B69_07450 [Chitinophagales bacterium]
MKSIFKFLKAVSIMPTDGNLGQGGLRRPHPKTMIADYLDGTLNPSDKTFFEQQIKSDPDLVKSVLLQKKIKYAFDNPDLKDDIALIQQARKNVEAESNMSTLLLFGLFLITIVGAGIFAFII